MDQAKLCIHNQAEVQTDKLPEGEGQRERNRDSSPTGQFTDTHFEDSSPTELKTVHRQNSRQFIDKFYIVFIWNATFFIIY